MIKKLDEYFKTISEAFENPLPIKWVDKNSILIGLFTVNSNIFQINCINKDNNIWKYDFYIMDKDKNFSPELTKNEKDKYRVLPTVKSGMQYLLDNKEVDAVVFGTTDNSRGRKKLYESFCIEFSKDNNLEFYTKIQDNKQIFTLFKKNIDKKILTDTIIQIVDEEKS
jgi:hypothetical protein